MPDSKARPSRKQSRQASADRELATLRLARLSAAREKVQHLDDWDNIADTLREVYDIPGENLMAAHALVIDS